DDVHRDRIERVLFLVADRGRNREHAGDAGLDSGWRLEHAAGIVDACVNAGHETGGRQQDLGIATDADRVGAPQPGKVYRAEVARRLVERSTAEAGGGERDRVFTREHRRCRAIDACRRDAGDRTHVGDEEAILQWAAELAVIDPGINGRRIALSGYRDDADV